MNGKKSLMRFDVSARVFTFTIARNGCESCRVTCYISHEALRDHFEASHLGIAEAFHRHEQAIHDKARQCLARGRLLEGEVFLGTADFIAR